MENLSYPKAQLLLKIFSQKEEDLDIQLQKALEWATTELGMDLGIISHIQNDTYTIKKFWPISDDLNENQEFSLNNTYCSLAIKQDDVFYVNHMAQSEFNEHSCYKKFKLESYIGKQFHLEGTLYGTLNFSSVEPRPDGFTEDDEMFVRLLSGWVASTIHRRDIQDALHKEHRLYKLISTNSAEMICMHKLDGTYTYVSPSVKNLLGYSPHELIGTNPYDIFHPDDLKRIAEESHAKTASGETDPTIQYRIRKKDGNYVWFDTATQPVFENGEVIALQTTSRDVTERKRLELLFQQSQKMANVGGWEFNLKSNELYWTEEVYRIHELDPSVPITVDKALTYYPSESRERVEYAMAEAISNGDTYDMELPFNTEKGNQIWVRVVIKAEFLGTEATHLYGTFQDITRKKRIEELFKETQEMANVGGWEYYLETGDLFWTDEVYRIHEIPVGTPVKVEDGISFYPEGFSRDSIISALEHTQKSGEAYDLELPFVTAKGNEIWVRAIGHAELIDGRAVKLQGSFQNITERKENEEKIRSQLAQLTQLKSTREKLYSIIAHDLRNSIYGITGLTELLIDELKADEIDADDLAEKLTLVQMSADNSYKLLDNMLTWVKLQSGMLNLNLSQFELNTIIANILDLLRPALDSKKIQVNQNLPSELKVYGDQNLISTILRNLINNAIKFSEVGSYINILVSDTDKEQISITVEDHGVGMSEDTIKNLFNSEIRPRKEGTMNEKGSGLGLILVKELAELSNGFIQVNSELNKGSSFILTIPIEYNS